MKKLKVVLDSSALFGMNKNDIEILKPFKIFVTPSNLFETCSHSADDKIKNDIAFVISKASIFSKLNSNFLPDRDSLIDQEKCFIIGRKAKNYSQKYFKKLLKALSSGNKTVEDKKVKELIVENTISLTQAFARDIEKIKEEFNKSVEKPIVGLPDISREDVFNYLFDGNFINFLVTLLNDSTLTEEELIKISKGSFFRNLNAAYKELLKEIIITKDRKAEKSDYFDFEFYMYLFSLSNPIDYLIVNNSRDFRDKFPSNPKIITWEEFKKKVTNDKGI